MTKPNDFLKNKLLGIVDEEFVFDRIFDPSNITLENKNGSSLDKEIEKKALKILEALAQDDDIQDYFSRAFSKFLIYNVCIDPNGKELKKLVDNALIKAGINLK